MEDLFKIDEEAFKDAFKIDTSRMNMDTSAFSDMDFSGVDMSDLIDADALSGAMPSFSTKDIQDILNGVSVNLTKDTMTELFNALLKGYQDSVGDDPATDITGLTAGLKQYLTSDEAVQYLSQKLKDILQPQLEGVITEDMLKDFVGRVIGRLSEFALKQENPDDFNTNFRAYLETDAVSRILSEELAGIKDKLSGVTITDDRIKEILTDLANGYGEYAKANIWHSLIRFRQLFSSIFLPMPDRSCSYSMWKRLWIQRRCRQISRTRWLVSWVVLPMN